MARRILIVDDDALMRRSLALNLEQAGYQAVSASSAEAALAEAQVGPPDLVLLDIGLPGMDGLDALRQFKDRFGVPVILLTARRRNLDQVVGLELGADDYITKPFDVDILLARIKTALRHAAVRDLAVIPPDKLQVGDLSIDPAARIARLENRSLDLTRREFDLLYALALRPDQVISIDDLLAQVWRADESVQPQVVYVHIRWLREKLEDDPRHPQRILTVWGVGYKLQPKEA